MPELAHTALDTCPPWCAGEQCHADFAADRIHQSPGLTVPVIIRRAEGDPREGDLTHFAAVAEVDLVATQIHAQDDLWIYLGQGEDSRNGFELTAESARRLHRELGHLLGQLATNS